MYYLRYMVEGTDDYVVVATTRPETIFGDTAMCINPADPRYAHIRGKRVIVPIAGRAIPVIEDEDRGHRIRNRLPESNPGARR